MIPVLSVRDNEKKYKIPILITIIIIIIIIIIWFVERPFLTDKQALGALQKRTHYMHLKKQQSLTSIHSHAHYSFIRFQKLLNCSYFWSYGTAYPLTVSSINKPLYRRYTDCDVLFSRRYKRVFVPPTTFAAIGHVALLFVA